MIVSPSVYTRLMSTRPLIELQCNRCLSKMLCEPDANKAGEPVRPKKWERLHNHGTMAGRWPKDLCPACVEAFYQFMDVFDGKSPH